MTTSKKTGRPTSLTPEVEAIITKELRQGATYKMAANLAGVTYEALRGWMRRGEAGEEPFAGLVAEISRAEEIFKRRAMAKIRKGVLQSGLPDWKAMAWILERRHRDEFGPQQQVTVKVEKALEERLDALEKALSPDEYERVLRAIAGEAGSEAAGTDPGRVH